MHILRRGIALPIVVVVLLVGAALWFVDVMSRPGSGGPVGLARPGAATAYTFVDDAVAEMRVGGARQSRPRPTASTAKVITALAVLEKKPLARWQPRRMLLSVGSYGCNLHCPFCQNHEIAQAGENDVAWRHLSPGGLVTLTREARERDARVIGIAYTYNEPLVAWEYLRDAGRLAREAGLANVLVSNGCANAPVIDELAPLVDAANIDLKGFSEEFYRWVGGDFATVRRTIERLAAEPSCHLEVTTLVIPGRNDSPEEMRALAGWLASVDAAITLHVTRYFPNYRMSDPATPVEQVYALADVAREALPHVFVGNC